MRRKLCQICKTEEINHRFSTDDICRTCVELINHHNTIYGNELNQTQLNTLAHELTQKHWNMKFTGHVHLAQSKIWKRRIALYTYATETITLNRANNLHMSREEIIGALLHELTHWYCFKTNKPYSDVDEYFIRECVRVGAPVSGIVEAQRILKSIKAKIMRAEMLKMLNKKHV